VAAGCVEVDVGSMDIKIRDGLLLARHAQGDGEAFAELVTRYRAPVYGYLVRMGVEPAARDDLFQDIFLRLHRSAHRFTITRPFKPWLFTIVANAARNHARGRRWQRLRFVSAQSEPVEPPDPAPDGERQAVGRQRLDVLQQAIRALPRGQREVLVLAAIEHQPLALVAKSLGVAVGTVKSRLGRARLTLARALSVSGEHSNPESEVAP